MRFNGPAHEQPVARLTPHPASSNLILVNLMSISSFGWRKKMRRPVTKLNLLGHRPFWLTMQPAAVHKATKVALGSVQWPP